MKLNFSNYKYKEKAKKILSSNMKSNLSLSRADAFIILIHGVPFEDLKNLCIYLANTLNINLNDAYNLIQYPKNVNKELILKTAYTVLKKENHLGVNKTSDSKYNTSSWISHSLYEAKACETIAKMLHKDSDFLFCYGLLHDYGRKFTHNFNHVIIGFENLVDLNLDKYAKGCLTHSFINGERYCNNEFISHGFKIKNNTIILSDDLKDEDIYQVLDNSNYSLSDDILNVADLIASDSGIVSPEKRINDIAKRKTNIDNSLNRGYFIASYHNLLLKIIKLYDAKIKINPININNENLETIKNKFHIISEIFFSFYNNFLINKEDHNEATIQL